MNEANLIDLLNNVKSGESSIDDAVAQLKLMPYKEMDFAKVDNHRKLRQGYAEAVYSPGKKPQQIAEILKELKQHNQIALATRAESAEAKEVLQLLPEALYDEDSRIITLGEFPEPETENYVLVITAGTSDIPVAQEAIITIKSNAVKYESLFDCGIAGAHRIFSHIDIIQKAKAIIVIAGMEGALASVVGGMASCPVIAVPTSRGYGANFNGLAPLLAMLNSCTSCVSVVNIDNGYSAGIIASLIIKQSENAT